MVDAVKMSVKHRRALDDFTEGLNVAAPALTPRWRREEAEWQEDRTKPLAQQTKPCPYRVLTKGA